MKKFKLLILGAALCVSLSASAQSPLQPRVYYLTNSTTFTVAGGGTNVAASGTTTINSQPFPIWRGRGFAFSASLIGTNSGTAANTFTFQFATVHDGTTNWFTTGTVPISIAMNGTTRVYSYTNILPTQVDNVSLGRLTTVATAHTASVFLDPTNTFISVIP